MSWSPYRTEHIWCTWLFSPSVFVCVYSYISVECSREDYPKMHWALVMMQNNWLFVVKVQFSLKILNNRVKSSQGLWEAENNLGKVTSLRTLCKFVLAVVYEYFNHTLGSIMCLSASFIQQPHAPHPPLQVVRFLCSYALYTKVTWMSSRQINK